MFFLCCGKKGGEVKDTKSQRADKRQKYPEVSSLNLYSLTTNPAVLEITAAEEVLTLAETK